MAKSLTSKKFIFGKKFTQSPFGGLSTANFEDLSILLTTWSTLRTQNCMEILWLRVCGYILNFTLASIEHWMSEQLEVKREDCDGKCRRSNCSPTVQLASFEQPPGAGFLLTTTDMCLQTTPTQVHVSLPDVEAWSSPQALLRPW